MAHKPGVIHFHNRLSISVRGISVKALPSSRHNGTITNSTLLACSCQVAVRQIHPHNGFCQIGRLQNSKLSVKSMDGYCFQLVFVCSFSLFSICFVVTSFYFIFAPHSLSTSRKGPPGSLITYLHSGFFFVCMCSTSLNGVSRFGDARNHGSMGVLLPARCVLSILRDLISFASFIFSLSPRSWCFVAVY